MAQSLLIAMLVSIVIFYMASPIFSQTIDQYLEEDPEDAPTPDSDMYDEAPSPDFDMYVEEPGEAPYEAESISPAEAYDMDLMHHYSRKWLDHLQDCSQKPRLECRSDIFHNMVGETTMELTNECCHDLLKIGQDCHLGLAQIIFSTYEYKNIASKAIPKSKQTWNDCVRRVGSQIGSPVSLEA